MCSSNEKLKLCKSANVPPELHAICHNSAGGKCLYTYDLDLDVWEDVKIITRATSYNMAYVCAYDQIIMIGGYCVVSPNQPQCKFDVQGINVHTGEIKNLNGLRSARIAASAASLSNEIYLCGGLDAAGNPLKSVEK